MKSGSSVLQFDTCAADHGPGWIGHRAVDRGPILGATTETVEVTAAVEALNRTNAEVEGVIESPQIKEIPVSGRNWASL